MWQLILLVVLHEVVCRSEECSAGDGEQQLNSGENFQGGKVTEVKMRKSRAAKSTVKNFKRRLQQRGDVGLMQQSRELKVLNLGRP